MFERFRKKKEPEQIIHRFVYDSVPNTLPKYIVDAERAEKWKKMGYEAKDEIMTFLNTLDRVDLMKFQDSKQFDGTDAEDAVWEATSDAEWTRDYPMGEHEYQERIPSIVRDTIKSFDITKLEEKVDGMQKKLDKITTLISNAEFKLCGKDAMKL